MFNSGSIGLQPRAIHEAHGQTWRHHEEAEDYKKVLTAASAGVGESELLSTVLGIDIDEDDDLLSLDIAAFTNDSVVTAGAEAGQTEPVWAIVRSWRQVEAVHVTATADHLDKTRPTAMQIVFDDGISLELAESDVPSGAFAVVLQRARRAILEGK